MKLMHCKRVRVVAVAAGVLLVAGCGEARQQSSPQSASRITERDKGGLSDSLVIPGVEQTEVGNGEQGARILIAGGEWRTARPIVVFLHGWGPTGVLIYEPWLRHLVGDGAIVIFPVYQDAASHAAAAVTDMQAGVHAALMRLHLNPASVVVAGHTTGATLAIDYAVTAKAAGLPTACGVYGVFPGVNLGSAAVPLSNPATMPSATRVVLIAGSSDPVPGGTGLAEAIIARARQIPQSRRRVVYAPGDSPNGPIEQTTASQRTYWAPLDRLIARCRVG